MKKLCVALALLVGSFLCGCAGLTETYPERSRRVSQLSAMQMQMAVDDFDYIMLLDRSSSLTQYHPHVGR